MPTEGFPFDGEPPDSEVRVRRAVLRGRREGVPARRPRCFLTFNPRDFRSQFLHNPLVSLIAWPQPCGHVPRVSSRLPVATIPSDSGAFGSFPEDGPPRSGVTNPGSLGEQGGQSVSSPATSLPHPFEHREWPGGVRVSTGRAAPPAVRWKAGPLGRFHGVTRQ